MRFTQILFAGLFISTGFIGLNAFTNKTKKHKQANDGKALFTTYCSSCHLLPDPASLTKQIWKLHVLPVMASRMGIIYPNYDPLRGLSPDEKLIVNKNNIIPTEPVLSDAEWHKLEQYVISNAPDTVIADPSRITRNAPLTQFTREDVQVDLQSPSLITGLKYNDQTKTLWIGNYFNTVFCWDYKAGVTKTIESKSPVVDFNFYKGDTYFTQIGKLYPTELSTGSYAKLDGQVGTPILNNLHRPVNTVMDDLDDDGVPEVVICNFGNKTGSLSLFKKQKTGKYTEEVLLPVAGAIKCFVQDMDGDGKKDIIAMFSQGDESVYIFYQKPGLKFKAKRVLRFPPNYGTTDMVLVDYNHDGLTDIVTVHGDNADYSNILKSYHGIRLNINQGNGVFTEKYFYPMYGGTRVVADDFDKDGDIDFAASAFFPDFGPLIDESFIYLENKGGVNYNFKSYILKSNVPLKSLTLEKADIDGDGDMDIIAGNFAQSPGSVPPQLDQKWKEAKYGLVIFLNQYIR
ncbi:FG-GAP repeat domain-containing protein [Mucilaginibacter glaciei]|uniref:VCBS repeat-containing protein n=1 Tax=Mucilaginibacter glaciei TaxID=2772109 RepID=A0A926S0W2_9SPHI|nr:VCBS repeat-containing protein [Mucilaginibacter glaciei]MBD1393385.1 VCBS repeat-containing protein [Mucilaginibacter glaciei]